MARDNGLVGMAVRDRDSVFFPLALTLVMFLPRAVDLVWNVSPERRPCACVSRACNL